MGTGFDVNGMSEALVSLEWGPALMDSLPPALYRMTRVALESLPGLRPAFSTIRAGRTSGSQQVTLMSDYPLQLASLKPLMDNLGLGHQHNSLMSAAGFLLGARFTLPPGSAALTLIPTRLGVELRLDVNLDLLPDPPEQLMPLLRLQMAERPRTLRSLEQWLVALTPAEAYGPGNVTVLSVRVRPDMPARVALYLRPGAFDVLPIEHGNGAHNVTNGQPTGATPS
jgi:hypothetical protein